MQQGTSRQPQDLSAVAPTCQTLNSKTSGPRAWPGLILARLDINQSHSSQNSRGHGVGSLQPSIWSCGGDLVAYCRHAIVPADEQWDLESKSPSMKIVIKPMVTNRLPVVVSKLTFCCVHTSATSFLRFLVASLRKILA